MENIIGYIKFIDNDYIDSFFSLESLWLSSISSFTNNGEEAADNLIDDSYEGRLDNLYLDMPAFITCFTEITNDSFNNKGLLKENISDSLIKCEKKLGKHRDFIFIPYKNMEHLLTSINSAQEGKTDGVLNHTTIFSRRIYYITNYVNKMAKLEEDYLAGNRSIEELGKGLLGTKDSKYKVQNEFRLGIILPCQKSEGAKTQDSGISIEIDPPIQFATGKFKRDKLRTLNRETMTHKI